MGFRLDVATIIVLVIYKKASVGYIFNNLLQQFISIKFFTITAEIHARSLANFYCQYADRHMNLKFMRRVSEREPAIRQFVIASWIHSYFDNVMTKFMINNRAAA